ncbi:MAG TPA: glycosyltransferase family 2 protein, partial [Chloroflexota bacterium]|nr:glycosyltransferase family 2 protein [Chloroflexota bacterium]
MNALVSVVVVNFNGRELTAACLDSLVRQTYEPTEIIVVDNGSGDGSVEFLASRYPSVRLVCLERNLGFAGGCNSGIVAAQGEYIATLNNDARAEPAWIAELVGAIRIDPRIGSVASKLLFAHAPDRINSAGICLDRLGIAWDRSGGAPETAEADVHEVFGASAGAALYRRALFDDIGCFDDDFFMYLEDVDLAWRARLADWRSVLAPRARVYHAHSATAGDLSPFKRYHLGRNKVWLIAKNYPSPYLWLYLPLIVSYDLAAILSAIFLSRGPRLSPAAELARLRGRLDGLLGLGSAFRKRRAIQARRRIPSAKAIAALEPIPL